ncbi:cytochrome P450 89A2-like [Miscanthus floridulus]|uniref:cytochrome P450 89A2-like n=1 Tax=Miscanthus floridulus TaxID=154761 RepID=UPI003457544C
MEESGAWPLLLLSLAASLLFLLYRRTHGGRKNSTPTPRSDQGNGRRLPPGPPTLLFLAKFLSLRRSVFDLGPLLRELHARHGPVISLRLLFATHVFVADRRLAHAALVQGGATFADRPPVVDPESLFSAGGRDINTSTYGPYWRLVRRNLATEALHRGRVSLFEPARRSACDALVTSLRARAGGAAAADTVTLRPFLRRAMFELLACMCFGARLGKEAIDEMEELQHRMILSYTTFPVFAFFPAVTKRLFRKWWAAYVDLARRLDEVFVPLIHATRGAGGGGNDDDPPCYADSLRALRVAEEGDRPLTDAEMSSLCSEFLTGGTDTTVTLVEWIMAELVNRPDVQAKVHDEVKNAPDGDLQQSMPYLKAVVLEGLRLHPPGHFVLPHAVRTDAEIGGYTVPKGAEVNFLVAEMGRDEAVWTAAREFRPDRFVDGGEGRDVDITGTKEIKMMPFGAGRRMCPGYALGMHHAEYFVARLVRDLEWLPPSADGEVVDMAEQMEFTTVMKYPLRARIVPRN